MNTKPTYEFEGKQLTMREIAECFPILSTEAIRGHLRAGRITRVAMLQHDPHAKRRATMRKRRMAKAGA